MRRANEYPNKMENELYKHLVEQVRDFVIYMVDPTGQVMTWNKGGNKIFGYTAEEVLGRNFAGFFPEAENHNMLPQRLLQDALRNGKVQAVCRKRHCNGNEFLAEVTITPLFNSRDSFIGFSVITDETGTQSGNGPIH